jgi:fatty acid desaturase
MAAVVLEKPFRRKRSADSVLDGPGEAFTSEEVAEHCTEDDCYIVINGKVYDVSSWAPEHPGGRVVYTYAGKDATDVFAGFHSPAAWAVLKPLYVGELLEEPLSPLQEDFRALRRAMLQKGLFRSSKSYYLYKTGSTFAILAVALAVLVQWHESMWGLIGSAFLLGLFWQQGGWLAHDYLHHQVFRHRAVNNAFGYFIGNVALGFSVDWWKSKHNTHHAAPNELDENHQAVDPDIDTLPLLAWSTEMANTVGSAAHRGLLRMQHYFFFPILLFSRFSWCEQSVSHNLGPKPKKAGVQPWEELAMIGLHYGWYLGMVFSFLPIWKGLLFVVLSQVFSGFLLSIVFVQSHNGMEVYSDTKDFVTAQIVSTRDITAGIWNDWFTGGLNYQIEHHLFPTLPRHNLCKVAAAVRQLCEKHGLAYEHCGMATGTRLVLQRLAAVAAATRSPPADPVA